MLHGSLENVTLDEVLGFLASSSKTGVLRISGDRGTGAIWVEDGQMVGAEATQGSADPALEEVVFELLRYSSGTFAFDFDETTTDAVAPMAVDGVVAQANKLLVEWRGIELVVPGLDYVVTPTPTLPADQVTITDDEWATLLAIGPTAMVGDVTNNLGLGELESLRRLRSLIERKLVLLSAPAVESSTDAGFDGDALVVAQPEALEAQPDGVEASQLVEQQFGQPETIEVSEVPEVLRGDFVDAAPAAEAKPASIWAHVEPRTPTSSPEVVTETPATFEPLTQAVASEAPFEVPPALEVAAPAAPQVPAAPTRLPSELRGTVSSAPAVPHLDPPAAPDSLLAGAASHEPPPPPAPPFDAIDDGGHEMASASVPPPPAPPSPAEIAKFGTHVEDASTISSEAAFEPAAFETAQESVEEAAAAAEKPKGESLLKRYLQSET